MPSLPIRLAAGAALLLAATTAQAAEKMTYLFPAPGVLPAFAPFQLAQARGYYAAEGLDVTFQVGKGGADVAKQVAVGNAELGGGIGDTPVIVRANGLPVKAVAVLGGQALTQIIVRKDAGVKSLAELKGKKIGVLSFQDTTYYNALAALASAGLKKEDVSIEAVGPAGMVKLMISGDLAAISGVPEWTAAIEEAGIGVDIYPITKIFPAMAQALLASDETIAKKPKVVEGFVRATLKAVRDIQSDPKKAAAEYVKAMPQHAGREAQILDIMQRYNTLVYRTEDPTELGKLDPKRIAAVQKFYVDNGIVQTAVPVAELYTNQFVK
ncbi:nitrate ABC transporter substrate-binding protein [Rhodoplanes elegans]|uniref:Nitrate ABC transporter substrate-binding protein n=1 Tax=Rhodoplanes elegans TaxID=29408 RepID=A0A327KNC8_9BRAD|nr:ABC transporter substrate-binding protein [Rhodoplanes elegans]MBK5960419.1 nitrate ABC transporter substrate-binding protein [Rhodoplanes elegans]RAI38812.1 nitrate ABC transporter substrate-binding protein [Rhodoplanes elegans]